MRELEEAVKHLEAREFFKVEGNEVRIKIQEGPRGEAGLNGCKAQDVILFAKALIEEFQGKVDCYENRVTLVKLKDAAAWQAERDRDRARRKVTGTMRK